MIIGIGNDMVDIRRIEKTLERFGERFITRIFTNEEKIKSQSRRNRAASYAKRFAAKEACSKALGTGMSKGVFWKDMGVRNHAGGKPYMELKGGAKKYLEKHIPKNKQSSIHLTLSDDYPYAQAFVVIEVHE